MYTCSICDVVTIPITACQSPGWSVAKLFLVSVQSYRMWWGAASPILNDTELLDGNEGHLEETHHRTHRFRRLFLDLLSMGRRGLVPKCFYGDIRHNKRQRCKWLHDDVIKWKHFPRYWSFVRGIHRSPVTSPQLGLWRGALMLSLICALNKRLNKQSWGW